MGKIKVVCKNCGKEFEDYKSNHRMFCCKECTHEYMRNEANKRKLRKCKNCGIEFSPRLNRTKFCSLECCYEYAREHSYTKVARVCRWCGKEFYPNHYTRKFCSKECGYKWYSEFKQTEEQKQLQTDKVLNLMSSGRTKKAFTKPHVIIDNLLDSLNINRIDEYNIKYYSIDIYLPDSNLMIEIMGDYWHTNPTTKYKECKSQPQKDTVHRDKRKHTYTANQYGIEILYLWESDIYNKIDLCAKLIDRYITNDGVLEDYNSFNYTINNGELVLQDDIVEPLFLCS